MRRLLLILVAVLAGTLIVAAGSVALLFHSNAGARWLLERAQSGLPGELRVDRIDGSLAGGLDLGGLRFSSPTADLRAETARLAVRPGLFPPSLAIQDLSVDGVRYRILDAAQGTAPPSLPDSLAVPLRVEVRRLAVTDLSIESAAGERLLEARRFEARLTLGDRLVVEAARLEHSFGVVEARGAADLAPPWRLDLAANGDVQWPVPGADRPGRAGFTASIAGSLDAYRVSAAGALADARIGDGNRFELAAAGSLVAVELSDLEVNGPQVRLRTRARVDWTEQRLALTGLSYALPDSDFEAAAELSIDLESGELEGHADWRNFTWPLRDVQPQLRSDSGAVELGGTLDDWSVRGRAAVWTAQTPAADLLFEAAGDRASLRAEILEGAALGGAITGRLDFGWTQAQPIAARLQFSDLSTADLVPGWPGRLSGELSLDGLLETRSFAIEVARLEGELRATPVAAHGRLRVAGTRVGFDGFVVEAGGSRASLQGAMQAPEGLAFELRVTDPGALIPGASGQAAGAGTVWLAGAVPRIAIDVEGAALGWAGYRAERVRLRTVPEARGEDAWRLRLAGEGLSWNGQRLESATAELDWNRTGQALDLVVAQGSFALKAGVRGALETPVAEPAAWRWSGHLERLGVDESGQPLLELSSPAPLVLARERSELGPGCLESAAGARFCVEGEWAEATGALGTLLLEHFPLDLVLRRLGAGVAATQAASGRLEFAAPPGKAISARADIRLSPGAIHDLQDPEIALETGDGRIGFRLADGRLSEGRADLPMPGQGGVHIDFDVTRVADGLDAPVSGQVRVDLADLDLLTLLVPAVDQMAGRLHAEFDLGGTVADPSLDGRITLADGTLTHRSSGLRLSDIQLSGAVSADRQTRLTGRFRAVEGVGRLEAALDLTDLYDPLLTLDVEGSDLLLLDTPTLNIHATPDIRLTWRDGEVGIEGEVTIPRGLVAPRMIPQFSVGESADAVIVAGELPGRQAPQQATKTDIRGELAVTLGPDVRIKLPIIEANVSGTTRFSWDGGAVPLGNGAFDLGGEVLVFGQLLQITKGTVSFPGDRADNPHLNISAEREIYGNSEIRRAGVLLAGTLRRPVIEPYTEPMTNRERARTLLVTGSDFDMERGMGTVDVGTYIAPKIFISYGIGVFNEQSVFSIRYDFARGWGIKATSGEDQTGVDISYTIEK